MLNFYEALTQFQTVLKFVIRYYPMVKNVLQVLDNYLDNPYLEKILFYISKAEELNLSGKEKKEYVIKNSEIPEEASDVIDSIISVVNKFSKK